MSKYDDLNVNTVYIHAAENQSKTESVSKNKFANIDVKMVANWK